MSDSILLFRYPPKYTQVFRILIRKLADFNAPLYKNLSLHYMLNPSFAEFTLHVTLQKSFSDVYASYSIESYITESYFCCFYIYAAYVCSKIRLLLFYISMAQLAQSFFCCFWIAGTANPGWYALSSAFFDQQTSIRYKNGRQQAFTVTAVLPC